MALVASLALAISLTGCTDSKVNNCSSGAVCGDGNKGNAIGRSAEPLLPSDPDSPSGEVTRSTESSPAPRATSTPWRGSINLSFVDLDSRPPKTLSNNGGATIWVDYELDSQGDAQGEGATLYGLGGGLFTTQATIAQWTDSARPNQQQCSERISTQATETLPVARGDRYCVRTAAGRTAFIEVGAFNKATGSFAATAEIWDATS
ncbi:hypothetical protein ABZ923_14630 [Streptomyces sp. NPDC046881]|uniref:hypothetical protein n=1 Tax=Streptomyces sp. NPDC046881 TaxID=3155374 RepID=UPI00340DD2CE